MKSIWLTALAALLIIAPLSLWSAQAPDGAPLFKTKCSACHGANGEGKPAVKIPAVKGTAMSAEQIVDYLTKGDSKTKMHASPISGLNVDQAKAVADFVKSLK